MAGGLRGSDKGFEELYVCVSFQTEGRQWNVRAGITRQSPCLLSSDWLMCGWNAYK